jgi:hypothetical protein
VMVRSRTLDNFLSPILTLFQGRVYAFDRRCIRADTAVPLT